MLRHQVRAGLRMAQVNGWRGNTSLEKRIEFDLYYIQNWSFSLDLRIILMTVIEVLIAAMHIESALINRSSFCAVTLFAASFPDGLNGQDSQKPS